MQKFKNTSEIEILDEILGQERAIEAMEVGLKIDNSAYNIYVSGHSGTGKTTYTLNVERQAALLQENNTEDKNQTKIISKNKQSGGARKKWLV